jgi:large subunit ribosomal protein L9
MKVILLKDIPKLGRKFEVKDVADGFASNMLLPRSLARMATPAALAEIEALRASEAAIHSVHEELARKNRASIEAAKVTVSAEANEQGHLFAAVHEDAIAAALKEQAHIDLSPALISVSEPIKALGEHKVAVKIGDEEAAFTLVVEAA